MVKNEKFQCPSESWGPEDFKTHPTFVLSAIFGGVTASQTWETFLGHPVVVSLGDHQGDNDIGSAWIKDTNYKLPWVTAVGNFLTRRKCFASSDVFHCYDQRIQGSRVRSILELLSSPWQKEWRNKTFQTSESDFLPQEKSTFDLILFPAKRFSSLQFSRKHTNLTLLPSCHGG